MKEDFNELSEEECMDMVNDLVAQGGRAQQVVKNLLYVVELETPGIRV